MIFNKTIFSEINIFSILIALTCLFLAFLLIYLEHFKRKMEIRECRKIIRDIYFEDYISVILISLVIFRVFDFRIAVFVYPIVYVIKSLCFRTNRMVKILCKTETGATEKILRKLGNEPTSFNQIKKDLISKNEFLIRNSKEFKRTFEVSFSFVVGLTVASILILLGVIESETLFGQILENCTLLTTLLCIVYPLAHWACVKNEVNVWFGSKVLFPLYYILFSSIFYVILIGIMLNGH